MWAGRLEEKKENLFVFGQYSYFSYKAEHM